MDFYNLLHLPLSKNDNTPLHLFGFLHYASLLETEWVDHELLGYPHFVIICMAHIHLASEKIPNSFRHMNNYFMTVYFFFNIIPFGLMASVLLFIDCT